MQQPTGASSALAQLPESSIDALRTAIADQGRTPADQAPLRAAIGSVARVARERAVQPEQLLISFKALWQSENTGEHAVDRASQNRLYEEMVTLCIHEYFAADHPR